MSPLDLLGFAGSALSGHRLRTALSLLGVAIGVAAVVLLTALGEGARRYVGNQFQALGSNLLIVMPGKTETEGGIPGLGGAPNDLTLEDVAALRRALPNAEHVVPIALGNETVAFRERRRQVVVFGSTPPLLEVRKLEVGTGSFLPDLEEDRSVPVVVIGSKVARELFRDENPLGQVVRVGDWRMRVIGTLAPRGTQLGIDMDEVAVVPVASAMRLFNRRSLFRVMIQLPGPGAVDASRERVIEVITERHDEEDVTCVTPDAVVGALGGILSALTLALAGIAAISLTVAGIGIMNVMLVSVAERTAEVGLLRALGTSRPQVLAVFLAEAVLISGSGGLLGLALSWVGVEALQLRFPDFPVAAPTWAIVLSLATSVGVGVVFGVLPARRAADLEPTAALASRG